MPFSLSTQWKIEIDGAPYAYRTSEADAITLMEMVLQANPGLPMDVYTVERRIYTEE